MSAHLRISRIKVQPVLDWVDENGDVIELGPDVGAKEIAPAALIHLMDEWAKQLPGLEAQAPLTDTVVALTNRTPRRQSNKTD
jgi:hypothetical protein